MKQRIARELMLDLIDKQVLAIGLASRGRAACELLHRQGARVVAVDSDDTEELRAGTARLRFLGVDVTLGATAPPKGAFSLAVLSPEVSANTRLIKEVRRNKMPLIGEFEFGYQQAKCLSIAIAGTNGKGTTTELVERVLSHNQRKTVLSGHSARPICSVVEQSKDLDFMVSQVDAFQLEATEFFRPAVAVLMNVAPDHLDRYDNSADYAAANARLFRNQQAFDWAIVQSEALARFRELGLPVPGKTITFSASDTEADIHLERGLLLSRVPNWSGPLLDMDHCLLRGPHNAENLMAALAVGHVLRLPLERMVEPLKTYSAGPHRFEWVAERDGVQFINDSKATNIDALQKALLATQPGSEAAANIWLIAGGKHKGLEYHDAGPLLSRRVKHAFLIGEAREKIRSAWSLFTPCTVLDSLVEAIFEAAKNAASGDVVLLSPACSSLDQFRSYQERGEIFCRTVKSITGGVSTRHPNMDDKTSLLNK